MTLHEKIGRRWLTSLLVFAFGTVLTVGPCRAFASALAESAHSCCERQDGHGQADTGAGCRTLCAATFTKVLAHHSEDSFDCSPAETAESLSPMVAAPDRGSSYAERETPRDSSSPPLYLLASALLL